MWNVVLFFWGGVATVYCNMSFNWFSSQWRNNLNEISWYEALLQPENGRSTVFLCTSTSRWYWYFHNGREVRQSNKASNIAVPFRASHVPSSYRDRIIPLYWCVRDTFIYLSANKHAIKLFLICVSPNEMISSEPIEWCWTFTSIRSLTQSGYLEIMKNIFDCYYVQGMTYFTLRSEPGNVLAAH